ncbi:type II secretion system protein GspG [Candidatus Sumerlaeota bacterium]|nr:type II secretion system protein GspG [Candidatus Sumerlaeota bacterium]
MNRTRSQRAYLERGNRGSSLIEIVVVVSILIVITSLFAFASQHMIVRAKYAKVQEDQRQIARALNGFGMDHGCYPSNEDGLAELSGPQKYISFVPSDPFAVKNENKKYYYFYHPFSNSENMIYIVASVGPDGKLDLIERLQRRNIQLGDDIRLASRIANRESAPWDTPQTSKETPPVDRATVERFLTTLMYDPTNGVMSEGDIIFFSR